MATSINRNKEAIGSISENNNLSIKPKFIPKIRTPYLMQDELIKQKKQADKKNRFSQKILDDRKTISNIEPTRLLLTTDLKAILNFSEEVGKLYGMQKKIAIFFVKCCIQRSNNNTGPITSETLCRILGSTRKTIKKIIQRMVDKGLINKADKKSGRGGFTSFALDPNFIDAVRLQIELELNTSINNQFINISDLVSNNHNILPEDWEKIELRPLLESFKNSKNAGTQFFGKAQLKSIYAVSGRKLSALDVQNSINSFAFGLAHYYADEPYKKMTNPGAILLETLKRGDIWIEPKYLSSEELATYRIYLHLSNKVDSEVAIHFSEWLKIDKEKKYVHYKGQINSTHWYDDKVYAELAWKDYEKSIWPSERRRILLELTAISDKALIDKFEFISAVRNK